MPIFNSTLKVYGKNPSDSSSPILIHPDNLMHTSRLPGGFWELQFRLPLSLREYWEWRETRELFRVVLEGDQPDILWEGRLEDMDGPISAPTFTCRGYWSNFDDSVDNDKIFVPLPNTTADLILKDMLDTGFHADTLQVNVSDQSNIFEPGVTIDQVWPKHFSLWKVLTDAQVGVLRYADSSDNIVDFAVWEDQISYLTARNPTVVTWKAFMKGPRRGVKGDLSLSHRWKRTYNAVSAQYLATGTPTQTNYNTDADSIGKFVRRERVIESIGESGGAEANSRRDAELASKKDIQQELDTLTITAIYDANERPQSLCKVRAGDVLQISDLVPLSLGLSDVVLDALSTYVIEEVACDHEKNEIVIRPDRSSTSLQALLGRANITTP